jgi:hypothetical protein
MGTRFILFIFLIGAVVYTISMFVYTAYQGFKQAKKQKLEREQEENCNDGFKIIK